MDFLFIRRYDGGEAAAKGGLALGVGEIIWAEAGAALHGFFFAGFGIEIRMCDDFSSVVLLHHTGLGIDGVGGGCELLFPFARWHVVTDVDAARPPSELGESADFQNKLAVFLAELSDVFP